jgi:hypothetical protein
MDGESHRLATSTSAVLLNGDEVQIGKFRQVFSTER